MTDDLRSALTRALQPHLPPELVPSAAHAGVAASERGKASPNRIIAAIVVSLPQPYRTAAEIACAIVPVVDAWWASRVVEVQAVSVKVTEHRG